METDRRNTVYIVDGDDAVRDSLTALLEAEGYATRCFAACEEFGAVSHPVDRACLLIDLQLPRYGGDELVACLSAHTRRIPVIVMSGEVRNTAARSLRAGAAAFIEKPLNSDELVRVLQKIFP